MKRGELIKHTIIGVLLFLGVCWSLATADREDLQGSYPNADLLASEQWLKQNIDRKDVLVLDVRADKYFDGELIPGAMRLPWKSFRYNNTASQVASVFVGLEKAQQILGDHGIMPSDTLVLYDSVERDGGATSSYVFWILDLLGHKNKKVLNGGIDAWMAAGGDTTTNSVNLEPVLYQADPASINMRHWTQGTFIHNRLGDPHYQIIDVRSRDEYLGEKGNKDLNDKPLKLGHIPTAINIEYKQAWNDKKTKLIKPYAKLRETYRGLNPARASVVYCHSGRRGSFSYFILRLMGFSDVILYEGSWNEWGRPGNFFPTELIENTRKSDNLPEQTASRDTGTQSVRNPNNTPKASDDKDVGYVSCGG